MIRRLTSLFALVCLVGCTMLPALPTQQLPDQPETQVPASITQSPSPAVTPTEPAPAGQPPVAKLTIQNQTQLAGVGSYCWKNQNSETPNQVCVDQAGVRTAQEPLITGTPYTATFDLPVDVPPEGLGVSVMAVTTEDEIPGGSSPGSRFWRSVLGWSGALPLKTKQETIFQEGPGLYVLRLDARWKDLGQVSYGFLVQVGDKTQTLPTVQADAAGSPLAAPQAVRIQTLSPAIQLGYGSALRLAVSPDGHRIAITTPFGVHLVDARSQTPVWFQPFPNQPRNLAFDPSGRKLAVGTVANILFILDAGTGKEVLRIEGEEYIHAAWSPDGSEILTSAGCDEVKVWDAQTGSLLSTVQPVRCNNATPGMVNAVWSADGRRIYVNPGYGYVKAYDAITYQPLARYQPHPPEHAFGFDLYPSPTQAILAIPNGLSVAMVDGEIGEILRTLKDLAMEVPGYTLAWSPDGQELAVNASAGLLIVDSNTGKHKQLLPGYHGLPGLTWLADGQTLVGLQTEDGLLSAVNVKSGKIAFSIDAFVVPNSSPILAKWGENELTTYNGVELLRWDALTGRLIGHTPSSLPIDWPVESCLNRETSADQRFHLQYTSRPEVKTDGTGVEIPVLAVTDQNGKKIVAQFEGGPDRGRDRSDWSPDGKRIVSGDSLGISSTVVWDAQTGKLLMELGSPFGGKLPYIGDLVWSPDGQFIAGGEGVLGSAGEDHGFVVIWNGQTGQPVRVFTDGVQNRRINCLAWSPDGTRLAAGLVSGQVMVWEATSGQPVALLEGHVDQVMGLNWSPDSRRIAANAIDRAVFVWNLP